MVTVKLQLNTLWGSAGTSLRLVFTDQTTPHFTEAPIGLPPIGAFSVSNPNKKEFMIKMAVSSGLNLPRRRTTLQVDKKNAKTEIAGFVTRINELPKQGQDTLRRDELLHGNT